MHAFLLILRFPQHYEEHSKGGVVEVWEFSQCNKQIKQPISLTKQLLLHVESRFQTWHQESFNFWQLIA
jgi:hypothetical protein